MVKIIKSHNTIRKLSSHFNDDFINHKIHEGVFYDYIWIGTKGLTEHATRELFIKIKKYEEHHDVSVKFDQTHITVTYKEKEEMNEINKGNMYECYIDMFHKSKDVKEYFKYVVKALNNNYINNHYYDAGTRTYYIKCITVGLTSAEIKDLRFRIRGIISKYPFDIFFEEKYIYIHYSYKEKKEND